MVLTPEQQHKVGVFSALHQRVEGFKPVKKQYDDLRSEIESWYADKPGNECFTADSPEWQVVLSEKKPEASWRNPKAVWKALGGMKSLALWSTTQKAVTAVLGKSACEELLERKNTGYRTLTPIRKEEVAAPKAA
jgi:hypothetical protein